MSEQINTTVKISDELKVKRFQGGNDDRFVMQAHDPYEGTTQTFKIFEKQDAIQLAKELILWAESQND